MTKFSEKIVTKQHIRSISLPNRSHPTTLRIEEELRKSKIIDEVYSSPTFDTISLSLVTLKELYILMDDLLNLQSTREIISIQRHEKWVDQLLDGSIKLLDICNIVKDYMVQMKEHVRDLQSAFRRGGDSSIISRFLCFRKKMSKDAKKLLATLKKINQTLSYVCSLPDTNAHLASLITSLREVSEKNIVVFASILHFLSAPLLPKTNQSKWGLVSKVFNKRIVACEESAVSFNEFQELDAALSNVCRMQNTRKTLKDLEIGAERVENGLEDIFRRLINTRASLLNIISQ